MQRVELADELFHGAISLQRAEGGIHPWRIPYTEYALYPPNGLNGKGAIGAGVRIGFISDTTAVRLELKAGAGAKVDCVIDDEVLATQTLDEEGSALEFSDLPLGEKRIELFLSQTKPTTVTGLWVDLGATVEKLVDCRPRWITYGSSITQCAAAASPTQTWPAIVAREEGLNLTCLGYGGNCHLEPMVARMVRDLPADFISMSMGINVYGAQSLSLRTFQAAIIGFTRIVREKHVQTPIAVVSPIVCPRREDTPNGLGITLMKMREEIAEAVSVLQQAGDGNLYYFDGLSVFGAELAPHLGDGLHPNAEGYRLLAAGFRRVVMEQMRGLIGTAGSKGNHDCK